MVKKFNENLKIKKKFNENKTEIQTSMKKLNNCDKKKLRQARVY